MRYNKIKGLQKEHNLAELQGQINDGSVWKMEGSMGRFAMHYLREGVCMLPKISHRDAYGNRVPSREEVTDESAGSYKNCVKFWSDEERVQELLYG